MAAVASRYARALADVATGPQAPQTPDVLEAQLRQFQELIEQNADLRNLLESPAVNAAKKRALIDTLVPRLELSRTARNLLFVLVDHRRMSLLGQIITQFRALVDEQVGVVEAHVSSAQPVAEGNRATLEAALAKKTKRRVRASYEVDPALIGGVVTRIGSTIYDGSVLEQSRLLRAKLSA